MVTSISIIDLLAYHKYRDYLANHGDETRACLVKLEAKKTAYRLKATLRLLTATLCVASLPLSTLLNLPIWLIYTAFCFASALLADIVSRGLFYLSVGAPVGEERLLKVAKRLVG